ncbi:uncharacterized protein LOC112600705 [Melanaphis sacchari]|uniref:uncharacterized protein LOC112600705 n=1 Tax=Melanaphis sacchari TaxID=742174 RepID=UPI000DC13159|nr:uncharacterized protein LOC112600705 [Melanaphis sacchari]
MCDKELQVIPVKKNKRGEVIRSKRKRLVINIYKKKKANEPHILYKQLIKELMNETGIGKNSIERIISAYNSNKPISSPTMKRSRPKIFDVVDDFYKNAIRQKVHSFWFNRNPPTLDKIVNSVSEDNSLATLKRTTMYNLLKDLNYVYTKRKRSSALSEGEDLVIWRRNYLRSIKKLREEGRPLYYLGETWCNEYSQKLWIDNTIKLNGNSFKTKLTTGASNSTRKSKDYIIIVHIGSREGFVKGGLQCFEFKSNRSDYQKEMNGDKFLEWFKTILPLLSDNAIIIMDNAPYHNMKTEQIPVSSWKKENIMKWLQEKNIQVDNSHVKAELLNLVQKHKAAYDKYAVDELAKAENKIVLRIPQYHHELNPIELIWSIVKEYVKNKNITFKLDDLKQYLLEGIKSVTVEDWRNAEDYTINEEAKFWEIDNIIDDFMDDEHSCIFNAETSDSSSDCSDDNF